MPRDLPIANGRMLVNFDSAYTVRDIYWPHIGQQNHTMGDPSRTGVWVNGQFAWFGDPGWTRDMRYAPDSLVTSVTLVHAALDLKIECADVVDFDRDIMVRRLRVTNLSSQPREIRLFFHHDWHLWENQGANTALYRPDHRFLVAYKRHCYAIVDGAVGDSSIGAATPARAGELGVFHWATGKKEFDGQQGTWRDAEDGELSGNPIAQGSVDSCAGFYLGVMAPGQERWCYQWLCLAPTIQGAHKLNEMVRARGPERFITRTEAYWRAWVNTKPLAPTDLSAPVEELYRRSLLLVRGQTDRHGAIIAATDADVYTFSADSYAYMWPRDGAIVCSALAH
ncbi:MAG TPA: glycoside hydrolase family 15 protein, partial [Ktedonobacterales bacterium]|nr:glycoside hydrolase family 15 protein [Ktedonobacterales bacterium]